MKEGLSSDLRGEGLGGFQGGHEGGGDLRAEQRGEQVPDDVFVADAGPVQPG
ncbi:hypothetical protein [Nonomuraea sp. B19D2]|uniref:hypothetical protein n=1 Tax=Nonomuraea sp. B19D2 TaxID=3159561 RepID=UPI0032DBE5CA